VTLVDRNKSLSNWATFALIIVGWTVALIAVAGLINLTGDCGREVRNCGETQRRISFLVLAFGFLGLGYYSFIYITGRKRS
jgi:hypothetical protein